MPNVGPLRHRVRIEQRDDGRDDFGTPLDTWSEVATIWGAIEDQRSREIVEAQQATVNEVTTHVRIRYRPGIETAMRLVEACHEGRVFQITGVRDLRGRARELQIECIELDVEAEALT